MCVVFILYRAWQSKTLQNIVSRYKFYRFSFQKPLALLSRCVYMLYLNSETLFRRLGGERRREIETDLTLSWIENK